jgi:cytochrome c peroxidase
LFATACASCHEPPTYTTRRRVDVDLVDEVGNRRFNPPSLLGAGHRDAFFHDGRARSLFEVLTRFGHPPGAGHFDVDEVADLVAFLETL